MARTLSNSSVNDTSVADLKDQIETLRSDLSSLTGSIANLGKAKRAELGDVAAQQLEAARQKGTDAADFVSARAKEVQHQANDFVTSQPTAALGIAAGIGFLVGIMSTRR